MSFFIVFSASVAVLLSVYLFPLLSTNYLWNLRGPSSSSLVADLFVTNGSIYTSDSSLPFADSMAIRGGRVLGIGNYSSVKDLVGYGTEVMNLEGKAVVPGFIDSHVHLLYGGLQMVRVELRGVNKKDEFIRKVKDAVRNLKHGSWLLGGGWNNNLWGEELPMASWIDDVTPHNPVWLSRMDGHMGLANSVALKSAGITNYTQDPDGGAVIRNTDGEPTGLLIDSAMKLVLSSIPEVSIDGRREALVRASNYALTKGVTTVSDFGRYVPGTSAEIPWEDFSEVYRWADISGKMKIRICLFFPMNTWSRLQALIHEKGRKLSQWLYLGGVKAFSDGSLGSNSALFYEPYVDDPKNCGLQVTDMESLFNMTLASDKSGLQVAIHAIGDRANDLILDMYKSVVATNGIRDRRFRGPFVCSELGIGLDYNSRETHSLHLVETLAVWIKYPSDMKSHKTMGHIMSQEKIEHAQHLAPGTVGRFGKEGIIASVQPDHLLDDADSAIRKLGVERAQRGSYLFRSLLASNLSFGSDWPVVDINPLSGIQTAMKRIPPGWENPWIPSERINLIEALNAHTISAARAIFLDEEVGSLSPGKFADFVVLSTESWDEFMDEGSASVKATYVGGVQLYP